MYLGAEAKDPEMKKTLYLKELENEELRRMLKETNERLAEINRGAMHV